MKSLAQVWPASRQPTSIKVFLLTATHAHTAAQRYAAIAPRAPFCSCQLRSCAGVPSQQLFSLQFDTDDPQTQCVNTQLHSDGPHDSLLSVLPQSRNRKPEGSVTTATQLGKGQESQTSAIHA